MGAESGAGSGIGGSMLFTVVIPTFNRVHMLPRAVESVLSQRGVDLEVIIVDDGSTDDTPSYLRTISDTRAIAVRRENGGLSAARNTGIATARGDWIAFLDDDDMALPGWLDTFAALIDDHTGAVCCGAEYRSIDGERVSTALPGPMGSLFRDQSGMTVAGTFAVQSALLNAIGGYDERMTCSHQTELWLRLVPVLLDRQLSIRSTDRVLVSLEWREPHNRPLSDPAALYQGTRLLLDTHRDKVSRDPRGRAVLNGVLGVSAARLGHWPQARAALLTSARAQPWSARRWLRVVVTFCPPVGRRVWQAAKYRPGVAEVTR